jgi:hypothetical protein
MGPNHTINTSSINAPSDLQSTMRASINNIERTSVMQHRLTTGSSNNKDSQGQIPTGTNQILKQSKKIHPLSAVQRTTKLSNNLYSVVNNKLVRNVQ